MKIALIAHDGKKADMVAFMRDHMDVLKNKKIELIATGTTGKHVESAGLKVQRVKSGPLGGDAQIAAEGAEGRVQAVFFFRDPLDKHPPRTRHRHVDEGVRRLQYSPSNESGHRRSNIQLSRAIVV